MGNKAINYETLGSVLKVSGSGWMNFPCPFCLDNKPENFWVSPDYERGFCHKCSANILITHEEGTYSRETDDMLLKKLVQSLGISAATTLIEAKEEEKLDMSVKHITKLKYISPDMEKLLEKFDSFTMVDIRGVVQDEVRQYCRTHHITPADLAQAHVRVLLAKSFELKAALTNNEADISWWSHLIQPTIYLFFPIFRSNTIIAGWLRTLNIGNKRSVGETTNNSSKQPTWVAWGFSLNGSILYTTALPSVLPSPLGGMPLVIVESPVDAIRVNKLGWKAVALGGHNLPKKMRKELATLPFRNFIVLLDSDVENRAVELQYELQFIAESKRGNAVIASIPNSIIPVAVGKKVLDPCDLTEMELRGILMRTLPYFRAPTEVSNNELTENQSFASESDEEADEGIVEEDTAEDTLDYTTIDSSVV